VAPSSPLKFDAGFMRSGPGTTKFTFRMDRDTHARRSRTCVSRSLARLRRGWSMPTPIFTRLHRSVPTLFDPTALSLAAARL
jgi:hypothetical protein